MWKATCLLKGAVNRKAALGSLEKPGRAEVELRKCLEQDTDTNTKLLKSYCCAWQRDILVQGHLYVTATCFCFYSNILGWETKVCLRCTEITAIVQCKTAKLIPNGITINVKDKKYVFTSFIYRDKVYHNLFKVWQNALLNYPYAPDQLCALMTSSSTKQDTAYVPLNNTASDQAHTFTNDTSLSSSGRYTPDDHDDWASDEVTGPATDQYSEGTKSGKRPSETSDKTNASTVSLGRDNYEKTEGSGERHIPEAARTSATNSKKVDITLASVSNAVTFVVLVLILLFVISMLVQLCRLSQVEPHLHFLLRWQPWCQCNHGNHR